jgi:hypothetical protein
MILIAHDSGKKPGTAFFYDGRLTYACMQSTTLRIPQFAQVVVEIPESRGGNTDTPVDDLIKLAMRAGEFGGYCIAAGATVEYVKATRWKGSLKKKICHDRARKVLDPRELALLVGKSLDAWDAVCIGLWKLGRVPGP